MEGCAACPALGKGTFFLPAKILSQKSLMGRFALQKQIPFLHKTTNAQTQG